MAESSDNSEILCVGNEQEANAEFLRCYSSSGSVARKRRVALVRRIEHRLKSSAEDGVSSSSTKCQEVPGADDTSDSPTVRRSSGDGEEDVGLISSDVLRPHSDNRDRMVGGGGHLSSCCCNRKDGEEESRNQTKETISLKRGPRLAESDTVLLRKYDDSVLSCDVRSKPVSPGGGCFLGPSCSGIVHAKSEANVLHFENKGSEQNRKDSKVENFLVGPGGSVLLGKDELLAVLPDQKVRIFIGSWNIASKAFVADSDLKEWLKDGIADKAHIFSLGIQEGPALDTNFPDNVLEKIEHCLGETFFFLVSMKLGVQVLAIFIHRSLVWFVSAPDCDYVRTNSTNVLQYYSKTKGAVAVVFCLFKTSMLFISCHLSYGIKSDGRIQDYKKIVQTLKFKNYPPKPASVDAVSGYDNVFWLGDLNFKVEDDRSTIEALLMRAPVLGMKDFEAVLRKDQLKREIKSGTIFHGFKEGEIRFHPTYKYDIGSSNLDSSTKNRVPSYTDRILYRRNVSKVDSGHIESVVYSSAHSVCFSDHKPVYSVLKVPIKAGANRFAQSRPRFKSLASKTGSSVCNLM